MTSTQLCEPCKSLFRGEVQPYPPTPWDFGFVHHPTAETFRDALALPCFICKSSWEPHGASLFGPEGISHGTFGYLYLPGDQKISLRFRYGKQDNYSRATILTPCESCETTFHPRAPDPMSKNTGSSPALRFMLDQYHRCQMTHKSCKLQMSSMAKPPARLIDVGAHDDRVFLREAQNVDHESEYACLSHCWGQQQPFTLTKQTYSILKDGLDISVLPRTFRHAVRVARVLELRYLWIDSLCIFQDSESDWSTEASRMSDIYSQSACTIAATAAKSCDDGLFFERDPAVITPSMLEATWDFDFDSRQLKTTNPLSVRAYTCGLEHQWNEAVERGPLGDRAWVCQELLLSPRIIHFSNEQLFWKCHECTASEAYPEELPDWAKYSWNLNPSILRSRLHQLRVSNGPTAVEGNGSAEECLISPLDNIARSELHFAWGIFRIHYTDCSLTQEGDKLVAIRGIAQQFSQALGDKLVAGLWRSCMIDELCWHMTPPSYDCPPSKPEKWRAPTWSWASNNDRIWVSSLTVAHRECQGRRQELGIVDDVHVIEKLSGMLESATLSLRCRPIRAMIEAKPNPKSRKTYALTGILLLQSSGAQLVSKDEDKALFSIDMDEQVWQETVFVHLVALQKCEHRAAHHGDGETIQDVDYGKNGVEDGMEDWGSLDCVEGLLIQDRDEPNGLFERVGTFTAAGPRDFDEILRAHNGAEERIITLS